MLCSGAGRAAGGRNRDKWRGRRRGKGGRVKRRRGRDAVRRCVGKRQGSTHTADTAAWVKSWNMTVSFPPPPPEHTALAGASLSLSWCVLSQRLACLTVFTEQKACFALRKSSNHELFNDLVGICLLVVSQAHQLIDLQQIVCHMDFEPVW